MLDALLALLFWGGTGGGTAGAQRLRAGPHLAGKRPVAGAGAVLTAGQRDHPASDQPGALALAAQCANLVDSLRAARRGALNQLSLLKEYASRQEVFDDAPRQHLTLLFGTLLPGC